MSEVLPSQEAPGEELRPAFFEALAGLRASLADLFDSLEVDPTRSQVLSRRLGLSRNLAWRVTRALTRTDPAASLQHLPGSTGMARVLDAFAREGAPAERVVHTRAAFEEFESMVALHAGDRATLVRAAAAIGGGARQDDLLERARRQAFLGNAGVFGVQAAVQLSTYLVAPSELEPGRTDLVQLGGLVGFTRLRPDASWPLFRRHVFRGEDVDAHAQREQPLDPAESRGGPALLRDFCSAPVPELDVLDLEGEEQVRLPGGAVGNTAALTCIYARRLDAVGPSVLEGEVGRAELGVELSTPAKRLQFDLLVHEDLAWGPPAFSVYGRLEGRPVSAHGGRELNRIPAPAVIEELGRGTAQLVPSPVPRYRALLERAFTLAAWDATRFRCFRLSLKFPPIPTTALVAFDLEGVGEGRP